MQVKNLPDGSRLYHDAHGLMQVHDFGGGVSLHVRRGIMTADFATHVIEDGERQMNRFRRFVLMVDGTETRMHTTEFREVMTNWFRTRETAVVHMLIRSKLLDMALTVANLTMGSPRAKAYTEASEWEAVGCREAAAFVRRPLSVPVDAGAD